MKGGKSIPKITLKQKRTWFHMWSEGASRGFKAVRVRGGGENASLKFDLLTLAPGAVAFLDEFGHLRHQACFVPVNPYYTATCQTFLRPLT